MKKLFLLILLMSALYTHAQSLKETLYGGRLKSDTGTVIRKTEDWSSKIDTSAKPVVKEVAKTGDPAKDSSQTEEVAENEAAKKKDNDAVWQEYIDELTAALRTDVLPSKKIKEGTYSVLIIYEIDVDGQLNINSVSSAPESSYLDEQLKQRLLLTAPKMTPLLNAYGKPRKAIKKYTMIISK